MILIDTHTHLYLNAFDKDRNKVISNAISNGVKYMFLPNIDSTSISSMTELCETFPKNCFPMMGLHPTSVKENYKEELELVDEWLERKKFYGIGETGIDLYWDKTFAREQEIAFSHQIELAKKYEFPLVIHSRNSFEKIYSIVSKQNSPELKGVFHCFTGNINQAYKIIDLGFMLGIGGVVTFKNSGLDKVVEKINLKNIILETDSPFLTPVPFRGKRNESAYTFYIAEKVAELKNITTQEVAKTTTQNALELFKFLEKQGSSNGAI